MGQADRHNSSPENITFNLPIVNADLVINAIKSLNTNAYCGLDGISCKILKLYGQGVIASLVTLINKSFSSCCFPRQWKETNILPLHIKGNI